MEYGIAVYRVYATDIYENHVITTIPVVYGIAASTAPALLFIVATVESNCQSNNDSIV